jgi:hypothetical protein
MMLLFGWTLLSTPRTWTSKSSTFEPAKTLLPVPFMPGLTWERGMTTAAAPAAAANRTRPENRARIRLAVLFMTDDLWRDSKAATGDPEARPRVK